MLNNQAVTVCGDMVDIVIKEQELTILCHGFNKSAEDMFFLRDGLNNRGIKNIVANIPSTLSSLEDCINSFHLQVYDYINMSAKINFIGHSMGGLVIRSYINMHNLENVSKCIFISTPHLGSKLAKIAGKIPLYKNIVKPIVELQPKEENIYLLKNKNIKIGLIIGEKNDSVLGRIFLSKNADGRVEKESALSDDANDVVYLPFGHKEIHHKELTLDLITKYLSYGSFE